jgi:hypothetical protein
MRMISRAGSNPCRAEMSCHGLAHVREEEVVEEEEEEEEEEGNSEEELLTLAVLDDGEKNDGLFSRMTLNTSASCFAISWDCAGDAASPPGWWAAADIFWLQTVMTLLS